LALHNKAAAAAAMAQARRQLLGEVLYFLQKSFEFFLDKKTGERSLDVKKSAINLCFSYFINLLNTYSIN
jgi:hypothetical protein